MRDGQALFVSSSLTQNTGAPAAGDLSEVEAVLAAAQDAGLSLSAAQLTGRREAGGWTVFEARGLTDPIRVRPVAVPTPENGNRAALEVLLIDNQASEPLGVSSFVDSQTGEVLVRTDLVDHALDNPTWRVFTNTPPQDYSSSDTRELWCWNPGAPGCERAVANPRSSGTSTRGPASRRS